MAMVYDRVFNAVFPPSSDLDVPTPTATPLLGSSEFGQPFGSPAPSQQLAGTSASKQIEFNRAWHTATAFLALKDVPVDPNESESALKKRWLKPVTADVRRAIEYVVSRLRSEEDFQASDDLLRWYFEEMVVNHFVRHVKPRLLKVSGGKEQLGSDQLKFVLDPQESRDVCCP